MRKQIFCLERFPKSVARFSDKKRDNLKKTRATPHPLRLGMALSKLARGAFDLRHSRLLLRRNRSSPRKRQQRRKARRRKLRLARRISLRNLQPRRKPRPRKPRQRDSARLGKPQQKLPRSFISAPIAATAIIVGISVTNTAQPASAQSIIAAAAIIIATRRGKASAEMAPIADAPCFVDEDANLVDEVLIKGFADACDDCEAIRY